MESTQVLECTQILDSYSGSVEEKPETSVKVATLTVEGVDHAVWNRENVIGRDSKCSIVLNSKAVSVEHAIIEADLQGGHFICDLGSTNKTKLGNAQLKPRVKYFINDGDVLKIANLKGVYRHENFSLCSIPAKACTPPRIEVTAIPETPERKEEEDAVASIIAETPCKDEGNEDDTSDGDLFGETSDSSALFLGPLKLSPVATKPVPSEIDSGELIKTDVSCNAERVGPVLSEVPKDASVYAVASQSVSGDQSSVLKGDEMLNDSSVCDGDSSDLVVGSQPIFTPEKRLHGPTAFDCEPETSVALDFVKDELKETLKRSDQWDNIDESIDEISNQMDTIDSLVENNTLQVTYTPPRRKNDEPRLRGKDNACKSNDLGGSLHSNKSDDELNNSNSSPNFKKINKNEIVKNLEECLDVSMHKDHLVKDNTGIDKKLGNSVVSGNYDKCASVDELATQDMAGDVSSVRIGVAAVADSSVDESTDIVVCSQQIGSSEKRGRDACIFDVDTVPMEYGVNPTEMPGLEVFELDTQQMSSERDVKGQKSGDDSNIYDLATQPFVVPSIEINDVEERTQEKYGNSAEVTNQKEADISISDLPTQVVHSSVDDVKLLDQKLGSVLEDLAMQSCDVDISDLATQSVSIKTNQKTSSLHETGVIGLPARAVQTNQNERLSKVIDEEDPHDVSISDMATQAVSVGKTSLIRYATYNPTQAFRKNQIDEKDDPCEMSHSDTATQQGTVHPNIQEKKVSEPQDTNSSAQPYRLTSKGESKMPDAVSVPQKNEHQDSEDIYNVMTQLPVESNQIILEESNTHLTNSDVKTSSHDISLSEMLTQRNGVKSDDMDEMQVDMDKNDELNGSESLKNKKERIMDEDTEDIFNVMTQLPVGNDKILVEGSDSHLINSEVERATLDVSLSDMMTQPTKSTSGFTRESPHQPVLDMSISDLATQAAAAKIGRAVDEDSEDIYNVMTQMPVEKEKILVDESDTQQINTDLENCELRVVDSAVKHISNDGIGLSAEDAPSSVASVECMKTNDMLFKIPTPKKDLGTIEVSKGDHVDVYMMDTQPMNFQASHNNSNLVDDMNEENTATKTMPADVPHTDDSASDVSIPTIETQDAISHLPKNPVTVRDVTDDVFEVDTMPMSDQDKTIFGKPEDGNGRRSVTTDDEVVVKSAKKVTKSSFGEHSVASNPQEMDPNSVEGRIRALSDKNVNSFATQQILVSSNTKSTVAELLETLEDTSSQVVRNNRKVKRLDYTDSEDSYSPVIRVQRKAKALPESDDEERTVEKEEIAPDELKIDGNESERASDVICNGNDKLSNKSSKEESHNVIDNESSKITISEALEDDSPVEGEKGISLSDSKLISNDALSHGSAAVTEKVESVKVNAQTLEVENTESCLPGSSKIAENLTIEGDEKRITGKSAVNKTAESDSLQLQLSGDASLNKSNGVSTPTTPEKQAVPATVKPSAYKQSVLVESSDDGTPEIPADFSGPPVLSGKLVLRQYGRAAVGKKVENVKMNVQTLEAGNIESCLAGSSKIAENLAIEGDEKRITGKSAVNNTAESESLQLQLSGDASLDKSDVIASEKQAASAAVTPSAHKQNVLVEASDDDSSDIPKDFFGTPVILKPVFRQYTNKKKLSLSCTSLLKGPNASSTPKSDIDSHSVIEMEETLQSPKASVVKTCKVNEKDTERNTFDGRSNTPKNVKQFRKVSPPKRKSSEVVEHQLEENDLLSSQESFGSQDCGRGKRKKLKKSFFGFDDNKEIDSFTIKSFRKDLESSEDIQQTGPHTTSMKPQALGSPTDENQMNPEEKADTDKKRNEEVPPKRQSESEPSSSDSVSSKKVKLSKNVKEERRLSNNELNEMDLTCVPGNRLQEGITEPVNIKMFRRSSSRKTEPGSANVMPKKCAKSCETSNSAPGRRRNVSTSESDSGKDVPVPHSKKVATGVSASTSSAAPSSASPTKSLRGRKHADVKQSSNSETEPSASIQKAKRNRVQGTERSFQEVPSAVEESVTSQGVSIKSVSENLRGVKKNNKQFEEGKIKQISNQRERSRQNADNCRVQMQEEVNVGKEAVEANTSGSAVERVGHECTAAPVTTVVNASSNALGELPTSRVQSPKKVVKRRGRPRKVDSQNEEIVGIADISAESTSHLKPSKSNTRVPTRVGRRKLLKADEESVAIPDSQSTASSQEILPSKRGRKGRTDNSDSDHKGETANKHETIELSDTLHVPSTSKTNVSKTRSRCKTPASIEDSSALETDQDSQSQNLSQGRRSGRERKKKETFDEIMSRKEEELRLKKLQRNTTLSQSPDKSRSTSRASIASSKIEDDGAVTRAPLRRGRPKKSVSVASTSSVLSVDDASTFSVPASIPSSPAGSNSSRRKIPRSPSVSSSQSVESLPANTKKKQEMQKNLSVPTVKVMFTGLADAKLSSMVKKLGGKVVEKPADCTVLVTDKVRRTVKFLCALGLGKPIVSPNWLSKSKAFNQFTDPFTSLLKDGEAEEKFDFQLIWSVEKARNSRLLEGYSFYVTASVLPPPAEIKPIIECSGGTYLAKPPARWPSNAAIISSPKDKSDWMKLSKHGVLPPILSAEALLSGVLQQQFDLGKHRLK